MTTPKMAADRKREQILAALYQLHATDVKPLKVSTLAKATGLPESTVEYHVERLIEQRRIAYEHRARYGSLRPCRLRYQVLEQRSEKQQVRLIVNEWGDQVFDRDEAEALLIASVEPFGKRHHVLEWHMDGCRIERVVVRICAPGGNPVLCTYSLNRTMG